MDKRLVGVGGAVCVVLGMLTAPAAEASTGLHVGSKLSVKVGAGRTVNVRLLPHATSRHHAVAPMLLRNGRPSGSELTAPAHGTRSSGGASADVGTAEPSSFSMRTNGLSQATSTCEAGCPQSDAQTAISPTAIVEVVDDALAVYSTGGAALSSVSLDAFYNTTDSLSRPRVLYDAQWSRWVVIAQDDLTGNTFLAASDNADPTSTWYTVPLQWGDNADYPILGMSQDAIFITANHFDASNTYKYSSVAIYKKAWFYNHVAGFIPSFLVPFNTAPSVDSIGFGFKVYYLLSADPAADTMTVHVILNAATQPSFKSKPPIAHAWNAPTSWAAQPGTSALIDPGDGRFEGPINRSYNGHLWFVHTIDVAGFPTVEYGHVNGGNNTMHSATAYHASSSSDFGGAISATYDNPTVAWAYTDVFDGTPVTDVAQARKSPFPAHLGGQPFSPTGGVSTTTVAYGSSTSVSYDLSSNACTVPPTFISAQYYDQSTGEWVTRFVHSTLTC